VKARSSGDTERVCPLHPQVNADLMLFLGAAQSSGRWPGNVSPIALVGPPQPMQGLDPKQ
jgi:hypothetical protein